MKTTKNILLVFSLLFYSVTVYAARIEIGSVPEPPENDPVFTTCARENIVPSRFVRWGQQLDSVEKRENIVQHALINPQKTAKVKQVIAATPLLYYSKKWKEYHTEYTYTYKVDGLLCGFKAIYSPATYDDFGTILENGGLYYLEYIPQPQTPTTEVSP